MKVPQIKRIEKDPKFGLSEIYDAKILEIKFNEPEKNENSRKTHFPAIFEIDSILYRGSITENCQGSPGMKNLPKNIEVAVSEYGIFAIGPDKDELRKLLDFNERSPRIIWKKGDGDINTFLSKLKHQSFLSSKSRLD